jgi:hypothetical protein
MSLLRDTSNPRFQEVLHARLFGDDEVARSWGISDFDLLREECHLPPAKAEAIVRSEDTDLDDAEVDGIAEALLLHGDILKCALALPSSEVLHHALMDLVGEASSFNDGRCEKCTGLVRRVQISNPSDARGDLLGLCYDILDHVIIDAGPATPPSLSPEPGVELERGPGMPGAVIMPFLASLVPALVQLDGPAQRRVLAYAYQELAETTDGASARDLAAFARLRAKHLPPLARQVFDALSEALGGTLVAEDLAEVLYLPGTRPLLKVAWETEDAIAAVERGTGLRLEMPLEVIEGTSLRFCLNPAACRAWRALSLADVAISLL